DINNDGYDDLGMRKQVWSRPYHDFISVILGGINGPDQIIPFRSTYAQDNMLHINGIGDVNADGIDDFHLLFHGDSGKRFTVFYGNSSFPDVDSLVVCDNIQDVVMYEACPVGDVNGDGIDDFASAWGTSGKLWFGSATFNSEWDIEMPGSYFGAQGSQPTLRHGDFNNDGIEDIVGSDYDYSYWNGRVGIWLGHQQFNGTVDLIINYPQYQSMQFGWAKAAGDFNADGFCDLAVSTPYFYGGATTIPGFIYIYSGNAQLIDTTVDVEDELAPVPESIWELNAYPNPYRGGELHIELNKAENTSANPDHVSLYNLKGQLVMVSKLRDTDWQKGTIELNIPDIPNGVYLVRLSDNRGGHTSKKIVITK
ncbi:MAG TPA: T9SS type A sorting domain-containing protein, partial [Candidatus Cloacimonadota bacterium]|nr:T9SS type A sorting domain-containing protein [Candidatus Cloacimonadota bacterium]